MVFEFVDRLQCDELIVPTGAQWDLNRRDPFICQPASAPAAQRTAVLSEAAAIGAMWRDEFNARFEQRLIQPITVIGRIADELDRRLDYETLLKGGCDQGTSWGAALAACAATGRPWPSATAISLVPLVPLGFADSRTFFCRREAVVDEALSQVDAPSLIQVLGQRLEDLAQHPRTYPVLKAAMASLIGV